MTDFSEVSSHTEHPEQHVSQNLKFGRGFPPDRRNVASVNLDFQIAASLQLFGVGCRNFTCVQVRTDPFVSAAFFLRTQTWSNTKNRKSLNGLDERID